MRVWYGDVKEGWGDVRGGVWCGDVRGGRCEGWGVVM